MTYPTRAAWLASWQYRSISERADFELARAYRRMVWRELAAEEGASLSQNVQVKSSVEFHFGTGASGGRGSEAASVESQFETAEGVA